MQGLRVSWEVAGEVRDVREHRISLAKEVNLSLNDVEMALWNAGIRFLLSGKISFSKHERRLDAM